MVLDGFDFVEGAGFGFVHAEERAIVRPSQIEVKLAGAACFGHAPRSFLRRDRALSRKFDAVRQQLSEAWKFDAVRQISFRSRIPGNRHRSGEIREIRVSPLSVIQSCNFAPGRPRFGLRWQPAEAKRSEDWSAAATPLFDREQSFQSGVALRFPPQSKKIWRLRRAAPLR